MHIWGADVLARSAFFLTEKGEEPVADGDYLASSNNEDRNRIEGGMSYFTLRRERAFPSTGSGDESYPFRKQGGFNSVGLGARCKERFR